MKYKVKVGSLHFEQGTFKAGEIIEVSEDRAALFDKNDIEILQEPLVTVEATAPIPETAAAAEVLPEVIVEKKKKTSKPKPVIEETVNEASSST